ncbi:helix-turn-helix domain-containing protein [Listeria rocourtiae]|uniref:helix-turn-helix domain-containing protein n=1 Tax=Listeria rocourtiae TaxID=647910 RepID=UPI003D2F5DDD
MKSFVSASAYRMLVLLNILFISDEKKAKKELTDQVGCSLNTLMKDVELINSIFPDEVAHIEEDDRMLSLKVSMDVSFDYLTANILSTSDLFLVGLSIFNDEQRLPKEWAEENFLGLTSLYARLSEMDDLLAKSRLILNRTPFQILGNELNIRFLFYHWISKCVPYAGWFIKDFDYQDIDHFIQKLEKHLHISYSLSARMDYAVAIGVSLTRIKQGYLATLEDEQDHVENLETYFEADKIDFSDLELNLDHELSTTERHLILLACTLGPFSYVDHSRIDFRMAYHKKYRNQRYQLGFDLAQIIKDQTTDFDRLVVVVLDYLTRFSFVQKKNLIIDVDYFTEKTIPDTDITQQIDMVLTKYEKLPGYQYIRDNKNIITSYMNDLFLFILLNEAEEKIIHVKVIAKNGFFWETFLKTEIRKHFSEALVLFSDDWNEMDNPLISRLIITDYPIWLDQDVNVMVWNMPPTMRDIMRLQNYIDQLE